jgi:5-methylcytosine-specific restriction endonuclease McrA
MMLPNSLRKLFQVLVGEIEIKGNQNIFDVLRESREEIGNLLSMSVTQPNHWLQEISLIALWRAFLSTLPASVFEKPDKPSRKIVESRISFLLGEEINKEDLDNIMKIVKRLQRYRKGGRRFIGLSSFDDCNFSHVNLLKNQSFRCNVCGYKFKEEDLMSDSDLGPNLDKPISYNDRSPEKLNRRAELDHILPVYLAGDSENNWQILCQCCNNGKSDLVLGFEGKAWFGSPRLTDLTKRTPRIFYMVLRRDGSCTKCGRKPHQTELRIVRRDEKGADLYPNLVASCIDCI